MILSTDDDLSLEINKWKSRGSMESSFEQQAQQNHTTEQCNSVTIVDKNACDCNGRALYHFRVCGDNMNQCSYTLRTHSIRDPHSTKTTNKFFPIPTSVLRNNEKKLKKYFCASQSKITKLEQTVDNLRRENAALKEFVKHVLDIEEQIIQEK